MLFNIIKALISKGRKDGLADKINIFYATNGLTYEQYKELGELIGNPVALDASQISYSFPE